MSQLGVDDLFTYEAVKWRRNEMRGIVQRAILIEPLDLEGQD